jgi:hypothetical protein
VLLFALGYFEGYTTVHLPFIYASRIGGGIPVPLRGLAMGHVLMDTFIPPFFCFGLIVLTLIAAAVYNPNATASHNRLLIARLMIAIFLCTLLWFTLEGAELVTRLEWTHVNVVRTMFRSLLGIQEGWSLRQGVIAVALLAPIVVIFRGAPEASRMRVFGLLLSVYLVTLAAGSGGFYGSHMLFALPLYCALFFRFVGHLRARDSSGFRLLAFSCLLLAALVFSYQKDHYRDLRNFTQYDSAEARQIGTQFDMMMDECGFTRYFIVGDGALLTGHSTLSTVGPLPFHLPFVSDLHPMLGVYYDRGLSIAQVGIIMKNARNGAIMDDLLVKNGFTGEPPGCATSYPKLLRTYMFYFRPNAPETEEL